MLKKNFNAILNTVLFKTVQETADELQLQTYVIGGFVRDHLLNRNRTNTDIDFVVIGSGIELAQALQKKLKKASKVQVFKTFGTAKTGTRDEKKLVHRTQCVPKNFIQVYQKN